MWQKLMRGLNRKYTQRELGRRLGISAASVNRLVNQAGLCPKHDLGERIKALSAKEVGRK